MMKRSRRLHRGATLIETLTASFISVLVLTGTVMTLFAGSSSWIRGETKIQAESEAQIGVRIASQQLREALSISVDSNGLGVSFSTPLKDGNGNYVVPAQPDGVVRRIALNGTNLVLSDGVTNHTIAHGVILTDPLSPGGSGTYKIFTPGSGTIVRQVTVEIVTQRLGLGNKAIKSRNRETIFIRNVPQLLN